MTTTATATKATALPPLTEEAKAFYAHLRRGQDSAQKADDIAAPPPQGLGIHPRQQQYLVDLLLQHGFVVCSSCSNAKGGYYLPTCAADVAPFAEQLTGRIETQLHKRETLYRLFPELRPKVLRTPPHRTRPTGKVTYPHLDFDGATKRN